MENSEFLWQAVTVASVVGNALQAWVRLKSQGKPQSVEIEKQPVSILKSRQAATMDNVKVLHKRITGIDGRIDRLEQTQAQDKKDIITEIIKIRNDTNEYLQGLQRSIGRLEGGRLTEK